ncbi:hypothetical protein ACTA71_005039 [Dictyostelium dimigraforme]
MSLNLKYNLEYVQSLVYLDTSCDTYSRRELLLKLRLKHFKKENEENRKEKEEIVNISLKLSLFLKTDSITIYTDAVINYLEMQMANEDLKVDKSNKESLNQTLKEFRSQKHPTSQFQTLKNSITTGLIC